VHGPSGCGKTTLLLAAGALLAPDDGQVLVDGRDPYRMSLEERAHLRATTIGFVFQQFHLIPYLTVLENVLAASLANPFPDARERAEELLDRFGMSSRAEHVPAELSTGERQRTALARALLNEPRLLLADEPTGNLDPDNAAALLAYIADFAHTGGSALVVTHSDAAKAHADQVMEMSEGRIVGGRTVGAEAAKESAQE
jgi:putative ABC transport system ATP-binding protein